MKVQTKASATKLAKNIMNKINTFHAKEAYNQWLIAEQYYLLNFSVAWKMTKEGSFRKFCDEHSNYQIAHINRYVRAFRIVTELKYTHAELKIISDSIAFKPALDIIGNLERKVPVKTLIKEHLATVPMKLLPRADSALLNRFTFELDDRHTKQLIAFLKDHGLHVTEMSHKTNSSSAMMRWLDTL